MFGYTFIKKSEIDEKVNKIVTRVFNSEIHAYIGKAINEEVKTLFGNDQPTVKEIVATAFHKQYMDVSRKKKTTVDRVINEYSEQYENSVLHKIIEKYVDGMRGDIERDAVSIASREAITVSNNTLEYFRSEKFMKHIIKEINEYQLKGD